MRDSLVIIGAGGHGKVCAEIAELNGYHNIVFLDDELADRKTVYGTTAAIPDFLSKSDYFVAIGDNQLRMNFLKRITDLGGLIATLIHVDSTISPSATVGVGSVVMAGAVINAGAFVGRGAIINTCSSVDHDCIIGDFSHISVGAHLAGTVHIGNCTMVGIGASVSNNLTLSDNIIIGAGGVVIETLNEAGTYVGVPVRKIQ